MISLDKYSSMNVISYLDLHSGVRLIKDTEDRDPALVKVYRDPKFWNHLQKQSPQRPYRKPSEVTDATSYFKDRKWDVFLAAFGPKGLPKKN
jgi:hypothetical protein